MTADRPPPVRRPRSLTKRPPTPTPLARRVRELMDLHGVETAQRFANMCHINESSIRNLWKGGDLAAETAARIASACDVSLDWLVLGMGQRRPVSR